MDHPGSWKLLSVPVAYQLCPTSDALDATLNSPSDRAMWTVRDLARYSWASSPCQTLRSPYASCSMCRVPSFNLYSDHVRMMGRVALMFSKRSSEEMMLKAICLAPVRTMVEISAAPCCHPCRSSDAGPATERTAAKLFYVVIKGLSTRKNGRRVLAK